MELIGVIKEYNHELSDKRFHDYKTGFNYHDKEKILNYLKNGTPIAVTMHIVHSLIKDDNSIIGGVSYLTDGYWIWPSYLYFYVDTVSIELPLDFLNSISKNKETKLISDAKIAEAINLLKLRKQK
ncbi:hypothetical protein [Flavobacterium sp. N2038]|uniref:hypothetical protein n=1 Tax=Flavobacterium sp. N2038 TaxID=2986829 RepID=UPI00222476B9|nr:hypothetical protein [Flavobacterium sp. N2038]